MPVIEVNKSSMILSPPPPQLSSSCPEQSPSPHSSDIDSVEDCNFSVLRSDSMLRTFSQISPSLKVQEMAFVEDLSKYGSREDVSHFGEPINTSGSLELPKYNPKKNYYEGYWGLFLRNEQLLTQLSSTAEERDQLLKSILQVEQFYNSDENLMRTTRERYQSGRKKHVRRCADV